MKIRAHTTRAPRPGTIGRVGRNDPSARSDCYVEVEPATRGGITLSLESKVRSLYGESISVLLQEVCSAVGLLHAKVRIVDQGALPFVLAARIEAAIIRALGSRDATYLISQPDRKKSIGHASLRRTRLYLPGNEPKFMINAGLHRPDTIVLDLEDSVAPEEKDAARLLVRNALRAVDFHGVERGVRINQGPAGIEDLHAILSGDPDVILVPKCETAEDVSRVDDELRALEVEDGHKSQRRLLPIIESALGVVNAYSIAVSSRRVCALAIGLEDYTADIGAERTQEGKESLFARSAVVNAAKAAGVQALDSVYSDADDMEGLFNSSLESKALGFDGKGCINPRQVGTVHKAFAPTSREIEKAKEIILAYDEARRKGLGVIAVGSKMVDAPVVARAERVLHLATEAGLLSQRWRSETRPSGGTGQ